MGKVERQWPDRNDNLYMTKYGSVMGSANKDKPRVIRASTLSELTIYATTKWLTPIKISQAGDTSHTDLTTTQADRVAQQIKKASSK